MIKNKKHAGFSLMEIVFSLIIIGVVAISIMSISAANEKNEKSKQLADQTVVYAKIFSDYIKANKEDIITNTVNGKVKIIGLYSYTKTGVLSYNYVLNYFPIGIQKNFTTWWYIWTYPKTNTVNVLHQKPCVAVIQTQNSKTDANQLLPILFYVDLNTIDKKKGINELGSHSAISQKAALILGGKGGYGYDVDNTQEPEVANGTGRWRVNIYDKKNKRAAIAPYFLKNYESEIKTQCLDSNGANGTVAPSSVFLNFALFPYFIEDNDVPDASDILWRVKDPQEGKDAGHNVGDYYHRNTSKTDITLANEVENQK